MQREGGRSDNSDKPEPYIDSEESLAFELWMAIRELPSTYEISR